jgi:hypothetical protein
MRAGWTNANFENIHWTDVIGCQPDPFLYAHDGLFFAI